MGIWLALFIGLSPIPAAPSSAPGSSAEIVKVLNLSVDAWNRGDINGFMESYADDPGTLFLGSKGLIHGYAQIRDMYLKSYQQDPKGMGTLSFEDIEVRPLGADYSIAVGRWKLVRAADPKPLGGYFTLTFGHGPAGWRIVCDHTH